MRNSSSKRGGHVQTREGTTSMLCCTVCALNIIDTWLIGKLLLEETNRVCSLVNLRKILFGLLCCVLEACSQIDHHMLPVPHVCAGTKLWSMSLFCNCANGSCFVQLNVKPSVGD